MGLWCAGFVDRLFDPRPLGSLRRRRRGDAVTDQPNNETLPLYSLAPGNSGASGLAKPPVFSPRGWASVAMTWADYDAERNAK